MNNESTFEQLNAFCQLANREIKRYYGQPDTCVFSTGVVCETLTQLGFETKPLRVEAAVFPDEGHGVVLGSLGDGTRRPASKPDRWKGHLCSLVEGQYLLDSTLDQVNRPNRNLGARPLVVDLRKTKWFDPNPPYPGPWTGLLRPWAGVRVRYSLFPRQAGWQTAGDFRPSRRPFFVRAAPRKTFSLFGFIRYERP